MTHKRLYLGFMALALSLVLVLRIGSPPPVQAGTEDAAMFYDELGQYGEWVDYEDYGPVWHPTQVDQDWRPYVNGRWVPTDQGQIFETQEPWGWATYHYGNWMPTNNYGWVWVPGRTWYPSTVTWRTSPESTPVADSYVGWAPIPPPNYVPPPEYAPANYYPGSPVADLITAPFYVFAAAANFLLGFGQPYAPAYSYSNCGCLAPPAYVPVIYPTAPLLTSFYSPAYYPPNFFGTGIGLGYGTYAFGPGPAYISRVTNINRTVINNTIIRNTNNIVRIRNVRAPNSIMRRHGAIRHIQPPYLTRGHRPPPVRRVSNVRRAQANLGKPNIAPPPRNIPRLPRNIPKATRSARGHGRGMPGTALPSRATRHLTPGQRAQIQKLPPNRRITPEGRPPRHQQQLGPGRQQQRGQKQHLTPQQQRQQQQRRQQVRPQQQRPGSQHGTPQQQRQQQRQHLTPQQQRQQQVRPQSTRPGEKTHPQTRPGSRPPAGSFQPGSKRGGTPSHRITPQQQRQQIQQQRQQQQRFTPQQRQQMQQRQQQQRRQQVQPRQQQRRQQMQPRQQQRYTPQQQRQMQQRQMQQRRPQPQQRQQMQRQQQMRRQPQRQQQRPQMQQRRPQPQQQRQMQQRRPQPQQRQQMQQRRAPQRAPQAKPQPRPQQRQQQQRNQQQKRKKKPGEQ